LGATNVDHFDREYAEWRISDEKQFKPKLPEEEEDMGLFAKLQEKGLNLGDVEADPYSFPDGRYYAVFVDVEHLEPKQPGYSEQLKISFEFLAGQPVVANEKYAGRTKLDWQNIPTPEQFDAAEGDEEKAKQVNGSIQRTVQRLTQLGLSEQEIDDLNVDQIHKKLKGRKYQFELNTEAERADGKKPRQFMNNLRPLVEGNSTAAQLLGDDEDEDA
jgi:hypothetical protein